MLKYKNGLEVCTCLWMSLVWERQSEKIPSKCILISQNKKSKTKKAQYFQQSILFLQQLIGCGIVTVFFFSKIFLKYINIHTQKNYMCVQELEHFEETETKKVDRELDQINYCEQNTFLVKYTRSCFFPIIVPCSSGDNSSKYKSCGLCMIFAFTVGFLDNVGAVLETSANSL